MRPKSGGAEKGALACPLAVRLALRHALQAHRRRLTKVWQGNRL